MSRRTTGAIFCGIAAILYASKYISAAIFGSNVNSWDHELFNAMLHYVGNGLTIFAIISLVIGIAYIITGEILEIKKK